MDAAQKRAGVCPLCIEELDATDRHLVPCKCGYQICVWCWHRIKDHDNLCPHCRVPYSDTPHSYSVANFVPQAPTPPDMLSPDDKKRKVKTLKRVKPEKKPVEGGQARVIVPNVVYLVGLPEAISRDEVLSQPAYLGQYGHVFRIIVHRNPEKYRDTCTAHVTFFEDDAARRCIAYLNGFQYQGKTIQAFIGTTKYPEDITPVDQSLKPPGEPTHPENPIFPVVRRNPTAADVARHFALSAAAKQINQAKMQLGFQQPPNLPGIPPMQAPQPGFGHAPPLMRAESASFVPGGLPLDKRPPLPNASAIERPFGLPPRPPSAAATATAAVDPSKVEQLKEGMMQSPRGVMDLATALNMGTNPSLNEVVLGTGGLYSYIWNPSCAVDHASWMGYPTSYGRNGQSPLKIAFVPNVPEGAFGISHPECRSSRCTSESYSETTDGEDDEMESVILKMLDDAEDNASSTTGRPVVPAIPLNL